MTDIKKILVTGASGFVGSAIVRLAVSRGLGVRAMARKGTSLNLLSGVPLSPDAIVHAEMTDPATLVKAVEGVEAVVHCAATTSEMAPDLELSRRVNVEGIRSLLEACNQAGVRRFIQMSSQSAHPANPAVYGRTKLEADECLRATRDIDWTILRPSIIYGPQGKGIFAKMLRYCRTLPVIPIPGNGKEEERPIHVDDVASAVLACLAEPKTIGKTYDLGGSEVLEFDDFIRTILKVIGKKKMLVHLPLPFLLLASQALSLIMKNPPVSPDNIRGIKAAGLQHVDNSAAQRDFNFAPRGFSEGLREVLKKK